MTIAFTILSGLALLVLAQIVIRSFIDPIYEVRKMRGEIADALIYYANLYMNPGHTYRTPEIDAAEDALRSLGSKLTAKSYAVPFYRFFVLMGAVPTSDSIDRARSNLIGLGNSIYNGNSAFNEKRRQEIKKALGLRIPD